MLTVNSCPGCREKIVLIDGETYSPLGRYIPVIGTNEFIND